MLVCVRLWTDRSKHLLTCQLSPLRLVCMQMLQRQRRRLRPAAVQAATGSLRMHPMAAYLPMSQVLSHTLPKQP